MNEKIFAHIKQHSINQASKTLILLRFLIVHPTEIFYRVSMRGRDMKGEYLVFLKHYPDSELSRICSYS
jgi:hypothetical protein